MEIEEKDRLLKGLVSKDEFLNLLKRVEIYSDYLLISKTVENFKEYIKDFKKIKIGILRSFTLETMIPLIEVSFLKRDIEAKLLLGGFNSISQDLIEPKEWIKDLDFLIIWSRIEDLCPTLITKYSSMSSNEKEEELNRIKETLSAWMDLALKIQKGPIIVANFEAPNFFPSEFNDSENLEGFIYFINKLNYEILKIARSKNIYIMDIFKIQLKLGLKNYFDYRNYLISKNPYSSKASLFISDYFARFIKAFIFPPKKVIVFDLDNTLWGGIIGEDGINGIKLGNEYPGNAFVDFQKRILNLYNNGVLLAISSKNNYEDAIEVFKKHPYMVLKEENFVVMKINWDEKENHLKEISKILNLGLDSFVFIDDSKYECERIKKALPEVKVYTMPENPYEILDFFYNIDDFDIINISEEDKKRGMMYRQEAKREELRLSSSSLEEFYHSLKMKLQIGKAKNENFQRISQLTQRTNQFNLTTKRYSEEDIKNFALDPKYKIFWAKLEDNFGDYGIIATAIIIEEEDTWIIDTFLLSCRAIQRTVETALLVYISKKARENNIKKIKGKIIYTKKNLPSRDFYKRHNFYKISENEREEEWYINLKDFNIEYPKWFQIEEVF